VRSREHCPARVGAGKISSWIKFFSTCAREVHTYIRDNLTTISFRQGPILDRKRRAVLWRTDALRVLWIFHECESTNICSHSRCRIWMSIRLPRNMLHAMAPLDEMVALFPLPLFFFKQLSFLFSTRENINQNIWCTFRGRTRYSYCRSRRGREKLLAIGSKSFCSFTPRRRRLRHAEYVIWKSLLCDRSEWFLLWDIGSRWALFSDCPRFYSRLNARVRRDANGIKRRDSE